MDKSKKCYKCIKYTLFVCCYFFWVSGAVLIAVGVYAKIAKEGGVVDSLTADPALLLISIGSLMFIITFFGCFGALRNGVLLLKLFLGILVAIILLQIAAAVLGFLFSDLVTVSTWIKLEQHKCFNYTPFAVVRQSLFLMLSILFACRAMIAVVLLCQVLDRTEQLMRKGIVRYREDMDLENLIDFVQKKFQCCGVDSYKDWSNNVYFNCSEKNPSLERCGVPFSCCIWHRNESVLNTMCGYEVHSLEEASAEKIIYTTGCLETIVWWGKRNLHLIGGMAVGLLGLEIFMSSLAGAQMSRIKRKQQNSPKVY